MKQIFSTAEKVHFLFLLTAVFISNYFSMDNENVRLSLIAIFMIGSLSLVFSCIQRRKERVPVHPLIIIAYLMIFSSIVSFAVVANKLNGVKEIEIVLRLILPLIIMTSYTILMHGRYDESLRIISKISFVAFVLYIIVMFFESNVMREELGYLRQSNWGNIIISTSPLVALIVHKKLRFLILLMLLFTIGFSLKRSAVVFLFLSFLSYLFLVFFSHRRTSVSKKNILQILTLLLFSPFVIFYGFQVLSENQFVEVLINRMDSIADDGGSGRTGIWLSLLQILIDSNWINLLFGDLSEANRVLASIGIHSAHNDYLGAIVNFGLVGFFLFVMFLVIVFNLSLKFLSVTSVDNVFPVSLFLGAIYTYTLTSGIFVYSTMFLPLFIMVALMLVAIREKRLQIKIKCN